MGNFFFLEQKVSAYFPFGRVILISVIVFVKYICISQPSADIVQFINEVERKKEEITFIKFNTKVKLKFFNSIDTINEIFTYEIVKDPNSIIDFNYLFTCIGTKNKQWLCNNTAYTPDTSKRKIYYTKSKSNFITNSDNSWHSIVWAAISKDWKNKILFDKNITQYNLNFDADLNSYILILSLSIPNIDYFRITLIFDENYFLRYMKNEATSDGMDQIMEYKIENIDTTPLNNICNELSKYNDYTLINVDVQR